MMVKSLVVMGILGTTVATQNVTIGVQGTCNHFAPLNACGPCTVEADCGGSGGTSYCWAARDDQCGPGPAPGPSPGPSPTPGGEGYCTKAAPVNACSGCTQERDCGGTDGTSYCWKAKDTRCGGPAPPGPACNKAAPVNACGACALEKDCGGSDNTAYCWKAKDTRCGGPAPAPGPAPGPAPSPTGRCNSLSPSHACKSCANEGDCGGSGTGAPFCWAKEDPRCGGPAPAPQHQHFCSNIAPTNKCNKCEKEQDCGGDNKGIIFYCWTIKDPDCPYGEGASEILI